MQPWTTPSQATVSVAGPPVPVAHVAAHVASACSTKLVAQSVHVFSTAHTSQFVSVHAAGGAQDSGSA